jgi:hypothetical protein
MISSAPHGPFSYKGLRLLSASFKSDTDGLGTPVLTFDLPERAKDHERSPAKDHYFPGQFENLGASALAS